MTYDYPLDLTGVAPSNLVTDEPQVITEINASFSKIIIPDYAPFYLSNLELVHISTDGTETVLQSDIDYFVAYPYQDLARETGKLCFGAIVVINPNAVNRSSGACGIGQALPCGKMGAVNSDGTSAVSPVGQMQWMHNYVIGRYGSWEAAAAHHNATGWY